MEQRDLIRQECIGVDNHLILTQSKGPNARYQIEHLIFHATGTDKEAREGHVMWSDTVAGTDEDDARWMFALIRRTMFRGYNMALEAVAANLKGMRK